MIPRSRLKWPLLAILFLAAACDANPTASTRAPESPLLATSEAVVCAGSAVPSGYVVLGETTGAYCPSGSGDAWRIGIPGPEETVCSFSPIPRGYVKVGETSSSDCSGYVMRIKQAGFVEQTCFHTPIPFGYVISKNYYTSDPSNCFGQFSELRLASEQEWICYDSPVPPGYVTYASNRYCGPGNSAFWAVKADRTLPIGAVTSISATGVVSGWACQPDHPGVATDVHLYANAAWPDGIKIASVRTTYAGSTPDLPVELACGGLTPTHFQRQLTAAELATLQPGNYAIYAHAIDFDKQRNPVIGPSRLLRVNTTATNTPPIGQLVGITSDGLVYGWACQPDHPTASTEINLYAGGPWGTGVPFASFRTEHETGWAGVEKGCVRAGFRHRLTPAQLAKLPAGTHMIYAHVIDMDVGPHPVLPSPQPLVVK